MAIFEKSRAARYDKTFFDGFAEDSARSARIVLAKLFETYRPNAVLDVGCGIGAWLRTAGELGATTLRGLDGPWVSHEQLRIPLERFERIDFEAEIWPEIRPADLAISLEVAEHLSERAGAHLVEYLTASAPVILFSAAIPAQGGEGHVNERWQSYWAARFAEKGFSPSLALRQKIWSEHAVEFWYQQNITVFYAASHAHLFASESPHLTMDVVHPRLYEIRVIKRERRRQRWKRYLPFIGRG
ncbi:MAG: class I SAM-dependent methyltransferase [Proteobacteria bacterium]|nr:class I SAM-dependent methyltransferase [Pseudomonadota bacterium]